MPSGFQGQCAGQRAGASCHGERLPAGLPACLPACLEEEAVDMILRKVGKPLALLLPSLQRT